MKFWTIFTTLILFTKKKKNSDIAEIKQEIYEMLTQPIPIGVNDEDDENSPKLNTNIEKTVENAGMRMSDELTDQLWDVLKGKYQRWNNNNNYFTSRSTFVSGCPSYEILKEVIEYVFTTSAKINVVVRDVFYISSLHFSKFEKKIVLIKWLVIFSHSLSLFKTVQNMPSSESRLANLIRDVCDHRIAIPRLSGAEPLELLLEIGLEKVNKDYEFIFTESRLCSVEELRADKKYAFSTMIALLWNR